MVQESVQLKVTVQESLRDLVQYSAMDLDQVRQFLVMPTVQYWVMVQCLGMGLVLETDLARVQLMGLIAVRVKETVQETDLARVRVKETVMEKELHTHLWQTHPWSSQ